MSISLYDKEGGEAHLKDLPKAGMWLQGARVSRGQIEK
jgi:hypothetical protein